MNGPISRRREGCTTDNNKACRLRAHAVMPDGRLRELGSYRSYLAHDSPLLYPGAKLGRQQYQMARKVKLLGCLGTKLDVLVYHLHHVVFGMSCHVGEFYCGSSGMKDAFFMLVNCLRRTNNRGITKRLKKEKIRSTKAPSWTQRYVKRSKQ